MKNIATVCAVSFCLLFLFFACDKKEVPRPAPAPASGGTAVKKDKQASDAARKDIGIDATKRKIIKEGDLYFETRDSGKTKALLKRAVEEVHAYVSEESQDRYSERLETKTVIRVPAENFDKLVETLSASADAIDRKNIKALDVTEEYVDLEARLRTRKDIENRYRQLLGRATKVEDVLGIEKQLGEAREQIESAEGKLKYFRDRIAFSTLTIVYYEKVTTTIGFTSKFMHGLGNGWKNFALFVVFLANIWPFIILLIIAVFIFGKLKRRLRSHGDK